MGKQEQGPVAKTVFASATPAGWKEAFTFNLTKDGKADASVKSGQMKVTIPSQFIKAGRQFAILALDKSGNMLGGPIAPGVNISLEALTKGTALLYSVSLDAPRSVIGKNTDKSIRAGVVWGAACLIDGMIDKIEAELGEKCTLVATGGLASSIIGNCSHNIEIRLDLIMQGLRLIYERNRSKQ